MASRVLNVWFQLCLFVVLWADLQEERGVRVSKIPTKTWWSEEGEEDMACMVG
jgi:hypothetical protein